MLTTKKQEFSDKNDKMIRFRYSCIALRVVYPVPLCDSTPYPSVIVDPTLAPPLEYTSGFESIGERSERLLLFLKFIGERSERIILPKGKIFLKRHKKAHSGETVGLGASLRGLQQ